MKLSDYMSKGQIEFLNIKKEKKISFWYHPGIGVEEVWVHRIPQMVEFEDDETKEKVRTVSFKRYVCPGMDVCVYCALKKWLDKHPEIPEDVTIWDLQEEVENKMTQFNKTHVLGQDKENWKSNFQTQKEVYLGVLDANDMGVKVVQMTSGTWEKVKKVIKRQVEQFGMKGHPEENPGSFAFTITYDAQAQANDMYEVFKAEKFVADEEVKSLLLASTTVDLEKVINKDHSSEIAEIVSKSLCNIDFEAQVVEKKEEEEPKKEEVKKPEVKKEEPKKPEPKKEEVKKPEVKKEETKKSTPVVKTEPKKEEPKKSTPPVEEAPEASDDDSEGTIVPCIECGADINLDKHTVCPKCKAKIFPTE